jgi:hypothetical protein
MRKFIKLSSEVQDAAKWCAVRGYTGKVGDALPANLSAKALREINANPIWFRLAVHMSKSH